MRSETQVVLIPAESVGLFKPTVQQLLRGVTFSTPMLYTIDDLFIDLALNKKQLWLFYEDDPEDAFLFAVTRLADFPQGKMMVVGLMAGRRVKALLDFYPRFELWSKMQGAICIHAEVGEKLKRLLQKRGFVATGYAMYKSLITMN